MLSGLDMERLLSPNGPYGRVLRPSDGKIPDRVAYVQCAGSRDETLGVPYCSRVCCMYAIKQAMLLSGSLPLADITIYYMDIRAFGKGYEQFYQTARAMGIEFVKAKVARIDEQPDGDLQLRIERIEGDGSVDEPLHDLVVLSVGMQPGDRPALVRGRGPRQGRLHRAGRAQARHHPHQPAGAVRDRHGHRAQGHRRQRRRSQRRRGQGGGLPRRDGRAPGRRRPSRSSRSARWGPRSWPLRASWRRPTMVSQEWPAAEQPDCPEPAGERGPVIGSGPVELSAADMEAGPGERLGVYVCHCGGNISDVVDVDTVADALGREEGVTVARHVAFMCSDEGQQKITEDIKELGLDRVIVAACTPSLHETTFRKAVIRAGMNPYLFLPANIREQVSWAHPHDAEAATDKAVSVVRAAVGKSRLLEPLDPVRVDAVHRILVVGGGVAGLRAALDAAAMGQAVTLIEKTPVPRWPLDGSWARSTPPTSRPCRWCAGSSTQVMADERIEVRTSTRLTALTGFLGDFSVTLTTEPRGVERGAGRAAARHGGLSHRWCPTSSRAAWPRARPSTSPTPRRCPELPAIDWANCTRCGECVLAAGPGIEIDGVPEDEVIEVGRGHRGHRLRPLRAGRGRVRLRGLRARASPCRSSSGCSTRRAPPPGRVAGRRHDAASVAFIHCVGSRQIAGVDEPGP